MTRVTRDKGRRTRIAGALLPLVCCAPALAEEAVHYADKPAVWAFYTPAEFLQLFGQYKPGPQKEAFSLCNLSDDALVARVEWTPLEGGQLVFERFLPARDCAVRELNADELPSQRGWLTPSWRYLGPRTEFRPGF